MGTWWNNGLALLTLHAYWLERWEDVCRSSNMKEGTLTHSSVHRCLPWEFTRVRTLACEQLVWRHGHTFGEGCASKILSLFISDIILMCPLYTNVPSMVFIGVCVSARATGLITGSQFTTLGVYRWGQHMSHTFTMMVGAHSCFTGYVHGSWSSMHMPIPFVVVASKDCTELCFTLESWVTA